MHVAVVEIEVKAAERTHAGHHEDLVLVLGTGILIAESAGDAQHLVGELCMAMLRAAPAGSGWWWLKVKTRMLDMRHAGSL